MPSVIITQDQWGKFIHLYKSNAFCLYVRTKLKGEQQEQEEEEEVGKNHIMTGDIQ